MKAVHMNVSLNLIANAAREYIANKKPMSPEQRKAMFAKRGGGGGGSTYGGTRPPSPPKKIKTPGTNGPWWPNPGMTPGVVPRPDQIRGNPPYRENPGNVMYPGGSKYFNERTGRYEYPEGYRPMPGQPGSMMPGGPGLAYPNPGFNPGGGRGGIWLKPDPNNPGGVIRLPPELQDEYNRKYYEWWNSQNNLQPAPQPSGPKLGDSWTGSVPPSGFKVVGGKLAADYNRIFSGRNWEDRGDSIIVRYTGSDGKEQGFVIQKANIEQALKQTGTYNLNDVLPWARASSTPPSQGGRGNDDGMMYAGGSRYFNERTGRYEYPPNYTPPVNQTTPRGAVIRSTAPVVGLRPAPPQYNRWTEDQLQRARDRNRQRQNQALPPGSANPLGGMEGVAQQNAISQQMRDRFNQQSREEEIRAADRANFDWRMGNYWAQNQYQQERDARARQLERDIQQMRSDRDQTTAPRPANANTTAVPTFNGQNATRNAEAWIASQQRGYGITGGDPMAPYYDQVRREAAIMESATAQTEQMMRDNAARAEQRFNQQASQRYLEQNPLPPGVSITGGMRR